MNFDKYDKVIWRINGSILLITCVGVLVVSTVIGYKLLKDIFGTRYVHDLVNVNESTKKQESLKLSYFQQLKGTDLILISLTSDQTYGTSYYSKSSSHQIRNYLLFNSTSKSGQWIWDSNAMLVLNETKIYNQTQREATQVAKGLIFEVIEKDFNGDGLLNHQDMKSVQYYDLTSGKMISIVSQMDQSIGIQQTSDDQVSIFYYRSGKSYFKSLTVSSMTLTDEITIGSVQ